MKKIVSLLLTLLIFVTGYTQPKQFCINDAVLGSSLKSAEVIDKFDISVKKARPFALNPMVRNYNNVTIGDTLQLALFPEKEYLSVIQSKTTDVNGTTVLVAKLTGLKFAWCFISISDQNALVTIDIPELSEKYTTRLLPNDKLQYLIELDENKLDILEDGQMPIPDNDNSGTSNLPKEKDARLDNTGMKSAQISPDVNDSAQIDILVVYTPAAKEWADTYEGGINNTINLAMANCNLVSENSKLGIKFNLVHSTEVDYKETGNSTLDIYSLAEGNIPNIYAIRDAVGADIVVLFSEMNDAGGRTWLLVNSNGNEEYAYLVVRVQQASGLSTIHEIGHNLGANHHKEQKVQPGPTSWNNWPENTWSAGWRWKGDDNNYYCDVMTYESGQYFPDGITHTQIPYFSDSGISFQGQPTGQAAEANNARTIREMKHVVAGYRDAEHRSTPIVYTVNVHDIDIDNALSGGTVVNQGDSPVTVRGLVWNTKPLPTLSDNYTIDGKGSGDFSSRVTRLDLYETYYLRAYATNGKGTTYGNQVVYTHFGSERSDFITRWKLPDGQDKLELILERKGETDYVWESVPAGQSGSGKFSEGVGLVKISNLPMGQTIRLKISPSNLKRYCNRLIMCPYSILSPDRENLIDVEQWGSSEWNSMQNAFYESNKLNISATDFPNLNNVAKMSNMFLNCNFLTGPTNIGEWSVATVINMSWMFKGASSFNQNIGSWNVSRVTDMSFMFSEAYSFNQDIGSWNVSKVVDMNSMFYGVSSFNQNIGKWDVARVQNMALMFCKASAFNQDIGNWNVSNVTNLNCMFDRATAFNQDIGRWDVSKVEGMDWVFNEAKVFNQDIGDWDVSKAKSMSYMFCLANSFNNNIGKWDVSSVSNMNSMFFGATAFNQNIWEWNVSKVTNMANMFCNAIQFNQDIGKWDVSSVEDMNWMLGEADAFNQDISTWDVSKVRNMSSMFSGAGEFNQDLGSWNLSSVVNISKMFFAASAFNRNIGNWNLVSATNMESMLDNSGIDCFNYSATLSGWNANPNTPDNLKLGAQGLGFGNNAKDARINLTTTKKWTITGDAATGATCDLKTNVIENSIYNSNLKVYPNPVTNELTIEIEGNYRKFNFQIINAIGQTVFNGHVIDKITIQTGGFAPGMYLVRLENSKTLEFKKIIKK